MFSVRVFGTCRWDLFGANGNYPIRNVCTFLEYLSEFMITIVLPLSASTSIGFSVTSL